MGSNFVAKEFLSGREQDSDKKNVLLACPLSELKFYVRISNLKLPRVGHEVEPRSKLLTSCRRNPEYFPGP